MILDFRRLQLRLIPCPHSESYSQRLALRHVQPCVVQSQRWTSYDAQDDGPLLDANGDLMIEHESELEAEQQAGEDSSGI